MNNLAVWTAVILDPLLDRRVVEDDIVGGDLIGRHEAVTTVTTDMFFDNPCTAASPW
jgi:hypothetical protein